MKCILLLLISALVTLCQGSHQELMDLSQKFQKIYENCRAKNNVTQAQIENMGKLQLPLDKNIQCAIACMAKEFEVLKSDNTLDRTKIDNTMKPLMEQLKEKNQEELIKKTTEVIDTCVPLQKGNSDECAAAHKAVECVYEIGKKNGLLPNNF